MHLYSILVLAAAFMPFAAADDCVQRTTPCYVWHQRLWYNGKTLANVRQWLFLTTILDPFRASAVKPNESGSQRSVRSGVVLNFKYSRNDKG
ncbi:hypothetical protein NW760_007476 [Fusarium oxysporum]|nr:hypothetical protein NW769_000110 [Fusarium oxysporum]KAJ4229625.1 hypothetical protein NW760_007476 [Fusarium oxysporum]